MLITLFIKTRLFIINVKVFLASKITQLITLAIRFRDSITVNSSAAVNSLSLDRNNAYRKLKLSEGMNRIKFQMAEGFVERNWQA
ncbi:hypothetical protein DSJ_11170 [Pantoea stewartii subsp. stewartii DC283]|uniref:Uncharacterized protein n=1 Tax=Pantoea stewartii subsp. stewartii DC283 TaxID=660596 RepID=A0ABN4YYS9_PANSE|nr:hypothetical protein DSJ_11170 [Pantoea stewartii subsp. stewartii DC283]